MLMASAFLFYLFRFFLCCSPFAVSSPVSLLFDVSLMLEVSGLGVPIHQAFISVGPYIPTS